MKLNPVQALYFEKMPDDQVQCRLCPHHCILHEGQAGICKVRINQTGNLIASNYDEVSSLALDPIEKKPLFHFYPGKRILSVGTFGCNLSCSFCQNYTIAQQKPPTDYMEPETLADLAVKIHSQGSIGLAFTYNEPSVWYEYILDTSAHLRKAELKTVLVSNAYLEKEPLIRLLPYIDALNIDVKAFNEEFYRKMCKGSLKPVKDTVEAVIGKAHVEITTLIIPGLNDSDQEIKDLARWLAALDPNTVLHLSRYHPSYKLDLPPTPEANIKHAQEQAREYLNFVYTGNLPGEENNTLCLHCGHTLIRRNTYHTQLIGIQAGKCSSCHQKIDYVMGV